MSYTINKDVSSRCVGLRKVAQPCTNLYFPSIFMSILAAFCLKLKNASTNQSIVREALKNCFLGIRAA